VTTAAQLAEYVRGLPDFEMVEDLTLPYNHMGATITDAVLQWATPQDNLDVVDFWAIAMVNYWVDDAARRAFECR